MPALVDLAEELVSVRADFAASRVDGTAPLAEQKALEAAFADVLDRIGGLGVELKGWAPLLVDFRAEVDGREVLLCWLEGERELGWYHELPHGFAGRRPLSHLGA